MEFQSTRYGYALKIEAGEEIFAVLQSFAEARGIRAAAISGLGAVGETELGFYEPATGAYVRRTFPGDHEIGSLTGNFSELEGRPFPHCHIVISGADFVAWSGHLFRGVVTVTCEVQIVTDPGVLRRVHGGSGFHPLRLPETLANDGRKRKGP